MKKFQQIYLEITNICNLKCPFCRIDSRQKQFMTFDDFKYFISLCQPYTNSFYLHLKGEPLLHPEIDEFLDYLNQNSIPVKITTNGTLLKEKCNILLKYPVLKHINISLQACCALSIDEKKEYFDNLFTFLNSINNQYIHLRNWINNEEIFKTLKRYLKDLENIDNFKINDHLIYHLGDEFTWPNDEKEKVPNGPCLGGKMQLGVMVNGDVVLCCLDDEGKTKLGNLKENTLEDILNSELYQLSISKMPYFDICQKCHYRIRFMKEDV